ncbi:MAG: hypothetical protein RR404_01285 [Bacilli bacterium]
MSISKKELLALINEIETITSKLEFDIKKINEIQRNCPHDIIATLGYVPYNNGWGNKFLPERICLLCMKKDTFSWFEHIYPFVDGIEYKKDVYNINNEQDLSAKALDIYELYNKIKQENPNISIEDLIIVLEMQIRNHVKVKIK